jgi:2-polyprenyl-6-methoxyphenol hydroxylase-like FAD-dependent oxidoreductase
MGGGIGSNLWGTSFASPMVAACAIALKQAAPNSTVAERENAMRNAPTQVTDTVSGRSYPFLDCINALSQLVAIPDPVFGNGFE